ncbi:WYL domain-containing protein [Streptomyces sp. NPDC032940]|uniref:helix-turn-helix transcriptional regulator n=1 Tax=Streptomyces sp. NPDC032940 TaxID=3155366 RepID=UPI0033E2F328
MPNDLSPTARALRTLEILQARPGTTAGDLAGRLGVTERAARRYVEILREAGIPVQSARGPHGGYRLGRGTRLPPVHFTQAEAVGLVTAVLGGQPAAADADDPLGTALGKVVKALPESIGRQAALLREYASAAPDPYAVRPDPAVTSGLVDAVAARHRVLVTYRSEAGDERETEVEPWSLVVRHGRWYLLCRSLRAEAVRTYRIDRIRAARSTGRAFAPPEDLDPVAVLEEHLGLGWAFATRVVFDAPMGEVAPWIRPPMGRLEPLGDGCVLTGSTRNPDMYAQEWLARMPFAFRVEGGEELRASAAALAARFTAAVAADRD